MDTGPDEVRATLTAWAAAEAAGELPAIGAVLTDDFTGIGPLGFILGRADWLDRHTGGALRYSTIGLDELQVRERGDHAVVVAQQTAVGTYQGHLLPAALRGTFVLRKQRDGWRVEHVHTSFIAGTPGAPPIPGRQP